MRRTGRAEVSRMCGRHQQAQERDAHHKMIA
jgi:hypothetical protein